MPCKVHALVRSPGDIRCGYAIGQNGDRVPRGRLPPTHGGLVLWFDNPTVNVSASDIGDSSPAGAVGCSIAPWDAGLNDNREGPGGHHSHPYSDEVAADCYAANKTRFNTAAGSGVLALLMLSISALGAIRSMRRMPSTQQRRV